MGVTQAPWGHWTGAAACGRGEPLGYRAWESSHFSKVTHMPRIASGRIDVAIVVLVVACAFVAHLLAITVWAVMFVLCGEFPAFGLAYYHSAVNYTTLGYGDVIMTPSWRLLGPLEAAAGALMFGVSTAMIFAVIHRLIQDRFADLRD
jgi:hypothetical protein